MGDENRYDKTGVITEISDILQFSAYLRKRIFKIRFSDIDFASKIQERIIKFETINNQMEILDGVVIDDLVKVHFYIEGRDVVKEDKTINYTTLVAYDIEILSSPNRDTKEDKEAVHSDLGRSYKLKESSEEELASNMVSTDDDDPFLNVESGYDKKKEDDKEFSDLPF